MGSKGTFFHLSPMIASLSVSGKKYNIDFSMPIDISMPLRNGAENVNAFFIPEVKIEPISIGDFTGSVHQGGSCNVNNIMFNPHGNGTHTECVGHISDEFISINSCLRSFFFIARLISIRPEEVLGDRIITVSQLKAQWAATGAGNSEHHFESLIIRTLPNSADKLTKNYSGNNPPYLRHEAAGWISEIGIQHLLLDLPSIDKEDDGGKLLAHRAYWNYPQQIRRNATITELIYVPDEIPDGDYILNLMIASFENDASPSKPVLYQLMK